MDFHSAWNFPRQTAEIEWRIIQKDNDDICLPLCLLFIMMLMLTGATAAGGSHCRLRPDARGSLLEARGRLDKKFQGPSGGRTLVTK